MRGEQKGTAANAEASADLHTEARIGANAWRFDLPALIDLLHSLGYQDGDIEYRSHHTALQQSAVVHAVSFQKTPRRCVQVTVNLGWLGPQSALPSYFGRVLDAQDEESMTEFLRFFSHHLLRVGSAAAFPERDVQSFPDWQRSRRQLRSLLGVRSLSTIHWVFGLVFPELEVAIKRTVLQHSVRARGMSLGVWALGDGAVCGGISLIPVSAVSVTLLGDEPVTGTGRPWASEAARRLHAEVFPILASHGLFLEVILVLRDQNSVLLLQDNRYLGYEPMANGAGASLSAPPAKKQARSVVLWSGEVPSG